MKFSEFLNESEESRWPLFDEVAKVERFVQRKKFDDQGERALKKSIRSRN